VWSDDTTRFAAAIDARGGPAGGDGGRVEVSGKRHLDFAGSVVTLAPHGTAGNLLLDPTDIAITLDSTNQTTPSATPFTLQGTQAASNLPVGILTALLGGGAVTVDATAGSGGSGSISVATQIDWNSANALTLKADTTIASTAAGSITNGGTGGLNLFADGAITLRAPVSLAGGSFTVRGNVADRAASFTTDSLIRTSATAAGGSAGSVSIQTTGPIDIQGAIAAVGGNGSAGASFGDAGGDGGNGGAVAISATAGSVSTLGIDTGGGAGGAGHAGIGGSRGGAGGSGGHAGILQLESAGAGHDTTVGGALNARGGNGGNGGNGVGGNADRGDGGAGGNGAAVSIASAGARVLLGTVDTVASGGGTGGTAGAGAGGGSAGATPAPGARAGITISAGTDFDLTSTLDTTGGTGSATVSLTVGAAGSGGALTIGDPSRVLADGVSIAGGGGTDRLVAVLPAGDSSLSRTSATPGALTLTGLPAATLTSIEAGTITGSAGNNTIDVSGFSGAVTVNVTGGSDTVTGATSNNVTLVGPAGGATWTITGTNAGSVAATTFTGAGALNAGTGDDTFRLNAGVASFNAAIDGGGGTNRLELTDGTNVVALSGTGAGTLNGTTSFANIGVLSGGSGDDTLAGPNVGAAFSIAGANSVAVAGIAATSIEALVGGGGSNTFTLAAGVASFNGSITGGGGSNALVLTDGSNAIEITGPNAGTVNTTTRFNAITALTGGSGTDTLTGPAAGANYTLTGARAVTVAGVAASSIETVLGGTGADTFTLASGVTSFDGSIDGGAGSANTLAATNGTNSFAITGGDDGTVNTTTAFSRIADLRGGSGDDGFTFAAASGATLSGSIDGGSGANTLTLSAKAGALVVRQAGATTVGNVTVLGGFRNIGTLAGNGSNTDLVGPDTGQTFTLADELAGRTGDGLAFSGVTRLVGGSGTDTLIVSSNVATITLDGNGIARTGLTTIALSGFEAATLGGGAGNNTIDASLFAGTVRIHASAGVDTVVGNGAQTTLVGTNTGSLFTVGGNNAVTLTQAADLTTATGVGSLEGGAGNDTFAIQNAGTLSGSIDGRDGANTLDLSNKTAATIVFDLGSNSITGVGVGGTIANIATAIGNGLNTTLRGSNAGQTFSITANNEITVGGSQTFRGVGNLTTGIGADTIGGDITLHLDGNVLDLGGTNTLTGTIVTYGNQTYAGAVRASAPVGLAALGTISATNGGNDLSTLSLYTAGTGGVSIVDANDLTLDTVSLQGSGANSISAGTALIRTTTLSVVSAPTLAVGGAAVNDGLRDLFTTGAASSVQIQAGATPGTHNVAATGVSLLPALVVSGDLVLSSVTNVTQAGALSVGGTTNIQAGADSISLTAANDFQGAVSLGGATTQVADINALTLGTLATGALTATSHGALNLGQGSVGGALVASSDGATVSQSGALTVTGPSSIAAGAGSITLTAGNDFQGAVSLTGAATQLNDVNALTLGSLATGALGVTSHGALNLGQGNVAGALVAISQGGAVTQSGALSVAGSSTVDAAAGSITLTHASNDFQGAVSLTGGTTQVTDANALSLGTLATGELVASSSGGLDLGQGSVGGNLVANSHGGAVTQSGALAVTGTSSIAAGAGSITLAAANDFQGAVSLTGAATQVADANTLTLGTLATGALDASSHGALDLGQGNIGGALVAASHGGGITQSGALTVAGVGTVDAGAGSITLTQASNDFQGVVSLTGGTTQITDINALALGTLATGALSVSSHGALDLGRGSVGGALVAASHGGAVSQSGALIVAGTSQVDAGAGSITLTAANDFQAAVSLTGGNTRVVDANALALGTVALAPNQALSVTAGDTITLGSSITTSADQTFVGNLALAGNVSLAAGAGRIELRGNVDGGGHDLALASAAGAGDAIRTGGSVDNVGTFTATGRTTLGGSVTAAGTQTYAGPVLLTTATTLTGTDLTLQGTVDGLQALTLAGSGTTTFGAAVGGAGLASLTDIGSGTTRIGGSVTTVGAQRYAGPVVLTAASTLSGATLRFDSTVDGAYTLALEAAGGTTLGDAIGATTPLSSLTITGPSTLDARTVRTTGTQTYGGAATLGRDLALTADGIGFDTLDGAHALTVQNPGTTTFAGAVGGTTALAAITLNGGPVTLSGTSVETTGTQHYGGAVQALNGDMRLTGGSLELSGGLTGAQNLLLQTDALSAGAVISGTGTLALEPTTASRSIGVAGAAGDLQVSQALLANTSGFSAHRIGRADGSGDIAVNALQLSADTTLQTGSGRLDLNGSVDGPFALALNSGGTTRIGASIGANTALRSLTTDNHADAVDWNGSAGEHTLIDVAGGARIVTTGAQTFGDPLRTIGSVRFEGGTITATQAGNEIGGPVAADAAQLNLLSRGSVVLGDVTLSDGGRIETAETLELAGALRLEGGTLSLVARGQPSARADFADPELAGQGGRLANGAKEASATLFQGAQGTVETAAGSLLVLRSPGGGSILLNNEPDTAHPTRRNDLRGELSAVSGAPGSDATTDLLGFVRIASTEIHAAGAPPANGAPSPLAAGIEGDVLWLSADRITTGATGQLRARLPYSNVLGARDSIPGLTLLMSPTALTIGGGFGLATADGYIQVRVGDALGGFVTVRPRGATGPNAFILLAGPEPRPFYDLNGKADEVRLFYNGDAPRTPQETGALSALMAIVEDARQTRFEEAVRTENVKSRLRSGVIAEVGAGRPATVGRESIRLPSSCNPKETTLQCE
jgi:hypothetical protein